MKVLPSHLIIKIKTCMMLFHALTAADICRQSRVSVELTPKPTNVSRFWFSDSFLEKIHSESGTTLQNAEKPCCKNPKEAQLLDSHAKC